MIGRVRVKCYLLVIISSVAPITSKSSKLQTEVLTAHISWGSIQISLRSKGLVSWVKPGLVPRWEGEDCEVSCFLGSRPLLPNHWVLFRCTYCKNAVDTVFKSRTNLSSIIRRQRKQKFIFSLIISRQVLLLTGGRSLQISRCKSERTTRHGSGPGSEMLLWNHQVTIVVRQLYKWIWRTFLGQLSPFVV